MRSEVRRGRSRARRAALTDLTELFPAQYELLFEQHLKAVQEGRFELAPKHTARNEQGHFIPAYAARG